MSNQNTNNPFIIALNASSYSIIKDKEDLIKLAIEKPLEFAYSIHTAHLLLEEEFKVRIDNLNKIISYIVHEVISRGLNKDKNE